MGAESELLATRGAHHFMGAGRDWLSPIAFPARRIRNRIHRGALAQLGEHLLCKQGVIGSIPTSSTNLKGDLITILSSDAERCSRAPRKEVRPLFETLFNNLDLF